MKVQMMMRGQRGRDITTEMEECRRRNALEIPEQSLSSKYFCIIVLHDCVPKPQHSPPKAMTAFIVFRLLALRCAQVIFHI